MNEEYIRELQKIIKGIRDQPQFYAVGIGKDSAVRGLKIEGNEIVGGGLLDIDGIAEDIKIIKNKVTLDNYKSELITQLNELINILGSKSPEKEKVSEKISTITNLIGVSLNIFSVIKGTLGIP